MKSILIIDNKKDYLDNLTEGLKEYKDIFSVTTARHNKAAIEIINTTPIDLLVIDFKLPETDEFELLNYINSNFPTITTIVTSIYNTSEIEKELKPIGVYGLVQKPIGFEEMAKSIIEGLKITEDEGSATGISTETFLQILSLEQKTCLLEVLSNGHKPGYYFINKGILFDAIFKDSVGQKAAIEMLNLDKVTLNLKKLPANRMKKRINTSIMALLLENSKDTDEDIYNQAEQIDENPKIDSKELNMSKSKLDLILLKFRDEIPEYISTGIVEISAGMPIAENTILSEFDTSAASAAFSDVVKSTEIGLDALGGSENVGSTQEILVSTEKVIILISILGKTGYYHGLAITKNGNLGFARVIMKKYLPQIIELLREVIGA